MVIAREDRDHHLSVRYTIPVFLGEDCVGKIKYGLAPKKKYYDFQNYVHLVESTKYRIAFVTNRLKRT